MATITLTNTLSAEEPAYASGKYDIGGFGVDVDAVNPGAKTGPYGDGLRNNVIFAPIPRTNLQIELLPGNEGNTVTLTVEDVIDVAFYTELKAECEAGTGIKGLTVTIA